MEMKNGTCPKCGSSEIYSGKHIPLKSGPFYSNAIPISLLTVAPLDNYVCVGCGLVESYIADSARIEDVAKLWEKVEPGTDHEK
jgi:predicted nucleic-acid-binding Zn-ribbon protein